MIGLFILSIGAINALIPIIVILILIAAAAGSTRGSKLFELFGISTLLGVNVGRGTISRKSPFKTKRFTRSGAGGAASRSPFERAVGGTHDAAKALKNQKAATAQAQAKMIATSANILAKQLGTLPSSAATLSTSQAPKQSRFTKMAVKIIGTKPKPLGKKTLTEHLIKDAEHKQKIIQKYGAAGEALAGLDKNVINEGNYHQKFESAGTSAEKAEVVNQFKAEYKEKATKILQEIKDINDKKPEKFGTPYNPESLKIMKDTKSQAEKISKLRQEAEKMEKEIEDKKSILYRSTSSQTLKEQKLAQEKLLEDFEKKQAELKEKVDAFNKFKVDNEKHEARIKAAEVQSGPGNKIDLSPENVNTYLKAHKKIK